jgi:hypothetical protein
VHISAVQASGLQALGEGQAVEFDIEQGRRAPRPPTCGHDRHKRRATSRRMRPELVSGAGSPGVLPKGPVGGMLMGKEAPLCGLRWPVCPGWTWASASAPRAGTARCPMCYRRWPLEEVQPCPWPARVRLWDQDGRERVVCRSQAAHPLAARLVVIEEDPEGRAGHDLG